MSDTAPDDEERVSLHPLTFEEALAGLLAVNPADIADGERVKADAFLVVGCCVTHDTTLQVGACWVSSWRVT